MFLSRNIFALIDTSFLKHVSMIRMCRKKRNQKLVYFNNIYFAWFSSKTLQSKQWELYLKLVYENINIEVGTKFSYLGFLTFVNSAGNVLKLFICLYMHGKTTPYFELRI